MSWWKLLAGAGTLALAAFAVWLMIDRIGDEAYKHGELVERGKWQALAAEKDRENAAKLSAAIVSHHNAMMAAQPVIQNSYRTVNEYAATPDGAALCLPADRVRGIIGTGRALFAEAPPGWLSGALPADFPAGGEVR